jgi:uncharacterized cupredoxin-like copper-binding protein
MEESMTTSLRKAALSFVLTVILGMASTASQAATTVHVSLWDKGGDTPMATGLFYGAPNLDMSKATNHITATPDTAKAGTITFGVTNDSKDMIHEMLVIYLADPSKQLPYIKDEERVDEEATNDKGEVSELDPGASGSLTLDLKPGKYLLLCNVPGHFSAGMWTVFTVTP